MSTPWAVAFVALWGLVVLLALLVLGTLRRISPVLAGLESRPTDVGKPTRASGLDIGTRVPPFVAETTRGDVLTDRDLIVATTVVLFLEPSCRACDALIATFDEARSATAGAQLVIVGEEVHAPAFASDPAVTIVSGRGSLAMSAVFDNERTPEAFVIADGLIAARGITSDWDQVRGLVSTTDAQVRT